MTYNNKTEEQIDEAQFFVVYRLANKYKLTPTTEYKPATYSTPKDIRHYIVGFMEQNYSIPRMNQV